MQKKKKEKKKGEKENKQNKKRMDMVNTEKRGKTGGTTTELPTNTPALSKISENNREKSKSRKLNRNSAGLCTV